MKFYTFWQGPDQLRNSIRDFLINNITSLKVHFKGSDLIIDYHGWTDSFEETMLDSKFTGSLLTTGDILFSILENTNLLKYEDNKKICSTLKTLLEIRYGIPATPSTRIVKKHGRAQQLPEIGPYDNIEQRADVLLNRIVKDGFPEKITLNKEEDGKTYNLDTSGSNSIFACSSLLMALAAGLRHKLEPEGDIGLKDRTLSLAREIAQGFCGDNTEAINLCKDKSKIPMKFPVLWTIQPGKTEAEIDIYATASALMALSYTYIKLKFNTNTLDLVVIENSILNNINIFCKLIEVNFGSENESINNKNFRDITRIINSLIHISDFLDTTDNKNDKNELIKEKLAILSKGLIYKVHHALIRDNGKLFDKGKISREFNGDIVQFSGVDVSSIFVSLLLAIPKIPSIDLKEIGYDNELQYLTLKHPIIKTLFNILENQVISLYDAEKMDLTNKTNIIGGYVWAGNNTSNPDCYQDIYFWQAAYAYWGVSLYIKYCGEIKSEVKNLYKLNMHRKVKYLENNVNNQGRLLLVFICNLLVIFAFLSPNKNLAIFCNYWDNINMLPLIIILCYFHLSALFSLYYFFTDKIRSYLENISIKNKWLNKLIHKTPLFIRPNLFSLIIIPIIIQVTIIKPIIDVFKTKRHYVT